MKDTIYSMLVYSVLIGGLIAGNWFGYIELLRVSIWSTWAIVVVAFITVSIPSKRLFENPSPKPTGKWKRILFICHLLLLVAAGWLFTATMYAIAQICLWLKRAAWIKEQN